jgi:hypothetical protein
MSEDTKSGRPGASLDATRPVSPAFNRENDLEQQISALSPKAQEKCRMLQQLGTDRLDTEKRNQQRSHDYRVMKVKIDLLTGYIRNQGARPGSVKQDPTPDLEVIDQEAERIVRDREGFYQSVIHRETEANLRQIIAQERQGRSAGHGEPDHDRER